MFGWRIILWLFIFFSQSHYVFLLKSNNVIESQVYYKISIMGTGYVGLVTGAILANLGHTVVCADINSRTIEKLKQGHLPFFEPGLLELIQQNIIKKRLSFTNDIGQAIEDSEIIFVCVGTPFNEAKNFTDLHYLHSCIKKIAVHINDHKIIVIKSTVPIGTCNEAINILQQNNNSDSFKLISNPEFLREGSAISDFFNVNPIVIGSESNDASNIMKQIYAPIINKGTPVFSTNLNTAEVVKYLWNSFSAVRISFINELANFCQKNNVDIFKAIEIMSLSEKLLPTKQICPGPGVGGSCLPKDATTLHRIAKEKGINLSILEAAITANKLHKEIIVKNIYSLLNNSLAQKTICILGLSFKKNTDDIRESPAIFIIETLLKDNALIKAYDPQAMDKMQQVFPNISYCHTPYEAMQKSDLVLVLTDWDEIKTVDLEYAKTLMQQPTIFDTKNIWNPAILKQLGYNYLNLGRIE